MIFINDPPLQPPADAVNTRHAILPPISSPKPSDISTPNEARVAQREGVTSSGPISSTNSVRPTTQPRPVVAPPPSRDVLPSKGLRDTGSKISLGLPEPGDRRETNEFSLHQVDSSRERNATRPRAQQVDLTASVQSSAKPSPPPPLKQPGASTSPFPPPAAPVLAKMAPSRARGALPYKPQEPSRGIPFESPHPAGEDREKAPADEQSRMNSSFTPRGLSLPPDNRVTAATGPPSQSQPVSAPRRLEKSNSRLIRSEGVPRETKRATEGSILDKKERKGVAAPEEYETRPEDSATGSYGAKQRTAEPNPPTSFTRKQAPTESLVERTYIGVPPRGNSIGVTPLSTQGQHKPNIEGTRVVLPPPLSRTLSVAEGPLVPTTSFGKPPSFLAALRLNSDTLICLYLACH